MPNPSRTWTIAINQTFSSAVDQTVQFRESFYALKVLLVAAGWTVTISSDGTTAGAGDNWTSAAALEINTAGLGAWAVLTSPANWTNATTSVILYANNASADTTPQTIAIRATTGTYSGGNATTLPTASATETAIHGTPNILGHTSAVAARYATWRSSRGDIVFAVKTEGSSAFQSFIALVSNTDASGGGRGSNRFWLVFTSSSSSAIDSTLINSTSNAKSLQSGGGADAPLDITSATWTLGVWTGGLDLSGETVFSVVDLFSDAASTGRHLGQWIDVYGCPVNLAFGVVDDSESAQTQRRVCVGDLMLYAPTASLPFV